jgi:indole-3-glycerol phosphate synthase
MNDHLNPIILQKQHEVEELRELISQNKNKEHQIAQLLSGKIQRVSTKNFKRALSCSSLAVIAEIKRRSPSKGELAQISDPVALAKKYVAGGANALSILTDEKFFGGKLQDLRLVAAALSESPTPVLRKDFIIDVIQIAESITAGADAILCIVAVLGPHTKQIVDCARDMGVDVLVEVHNHAELEIALKCNAEIIGINNRNLNTLEVDTQCALQLVSDIPDNIIKVAESGITDPVLAHKYFNAGFNAVLIGEVLVKSANPEMFIRECTHA